MVSWGSPHLRQSCPLVSALVPPPTPTGSSSLGPPSVTPALGREDLAQSLLAASHHSFRKCHLLCGPLSLCPWSSACSDADPPWELTMCASSPAGQSRLLSPPGPGRADGRTGSQHWAWCHSQGACIRKAPCHLEELGRPRLAERVTSLALESPKGHMSCSLWASP